MPAGGPPAAQPGSKDKFAENDVDNVEFVQVPSTAENQFTILIDHDGLLQNGDPQPVSVVIVNAGGLSCAGNFLEGFDYLALDF